MTDLIWQEAQNRHNAEEDPSSAPLTLSAFFKTTLYNEQQNWFLWLPVAMAFGIALYFSLRIEPTWTTVSIVLAIPALALVVGRKYTLASLFSIFVLVMAIGFSLAKVNTIRVAAPVIQKRIGPVKVKGYVHNIARFSQGKMKLVIRPSEIQRLSPAKIPYKIRLTLRKAPAKLNLLPGDKVEFTAIIFPPPEPTHPGGFDFARKNWFDGIGGNGFILRAPRVVKSDLHLSAYDRFKVSVERFRQNVSQRMQSHLEGDKAGVAAALIAGDRDAISKPVLSALRDAGLSHLLAISGLHMALFAGTIFWLLRAMFALNMTLILRYPVKKWAAAGALVGAVFYLVLSGATIATQRAFIMITIMFIAIMLDRPAISLRNIAIAALIILCIQPISLISVSFQMSFAATTALVAFYEWYRARDIKIASRLGASQGMYMASKVVFYIFGIALTSLIASLATGPFAAYYFQRIAGYGLLANVLCLPVIGIVVMPAGLIALILMPLGLEGIALTVMGWGLDIILDIASWVSTLPNAARNIPAFSSFSLYSMVIGGLWLCLWQSRWRLFGGAGIVLGLVLMPYNQLPDIYVAANSKNMAVRASDGHLVVAKPRREKFAVNKWLERDGDFATPKQAGARAGFTCDRDGCVFKLPHNRLLAYSQNLRAVEEDCQRADILIARVPVHQKCDKPSIIIDWFDLWRNGAHTITFDDLHDTVLQNAQTIRGMRPWVRQRRKARKHVKKKR